MVISVVKLHSLFRFLSFSLLFYIYIHKLYALNIYRVPLRVIITIIDGNIFLLDFTFNSLREHSKSKLF